MPFSTAQVNLQTCFLRCLFNVETQPGPCNLVDQFRIDQILPFNLSRLFHKFGIHMNFFILFFYFSRMFILLSRESDQCAIRARLGVASHLSTTPR